MLRYFTILSSLSLSFYENKVIYYMNDLKISMKNIVKWSKNRRNKQTRREKREKRELIKPEILLSFVIYNINNRFDLSVSVRFKKWLFSKEQTRKEGFKISGWYRKKKNKNVFQKSINCIYLHWVYLKRFMIYKVYANKFLWTNIIVIVNQSKLQLFVHRS